MAKRQNVSGLNIIDVHSRVGGESTRPDYIQETMKVFDLIKEKRKQAVEYNNELKDNQRSSFQTKADEINSRLSTYDKGGREAGLHTSVYDNTYDYIEQLKVEFEKYNTVGSADNPENKKKRMEIMGRLQQIQKATTDFRQNLLTIGKLFGKELDPTQFNKGIPTIDLAIGEQILNMDGDYKNVQTVWNADTNSMMLEVTITEDMYNGMTIVDKRNPKYKPGEVISWNIQDLESKFPGKSNVDSMIQSIDGFHAENQRSAQQAKLGDKFKNEMYIEDIKKTIGGDKISASHIFQSTDSHTDWNDWSTDQDDGFSGNYDKGSWAHALEISEMKDKDGKSIFRFKDIDDEIFSEAAFNLIQKGVITEDELFLLRLKVAPYEGLKGFETGDGLSQEEYQLIMSTDLKSQVIDALVNPQNDAYDHELSVEEYSKWRASSAQMDWNDEQKALQEKENKKNYDFKGSGPLKGDMRYTVKGQSVLGTDITARFNFFANNKKFDSYDGAYTFTPGKDGSWKITGPSQEDENKIVTKTVSQEWVADIMGFQNYRSRLGVSKDYKWKTSIGAVIATPANTQGIFADDTSEVDVNNLLNPFK